jgi:hypothetical protein
VEAAAYAVADPARPGRRPRLTGTGTGTAAGIVTGWARGPHGSVRARARKPVVADGASRLYRPPGTGVAGRWAGTGS